MWIRRDFALGFVGDVGDLAKPVMAAEGTGDMPEARAGLGHEPADCLWSVLVSADKNDVDLASAFIRTMDEGESDISHRL